MTKRMSINAGVIPAEPGWRAVVTNGETIHVIPVVGWTWEARIFHDDEPPGPALDPIYGRALVLSPAGDGSVGQIDDVIEDLGDGWKFESFLAPRKNYGDEESDGWETIKRII